MKLLFVLSRFPYPTDKGDKLRAYYQIKELSRTNDVYVICLATKLPTEEQRHEVAKYCRLLEIIELTRVERAQNLFSALFAKEPFQVFYFRKKLMKERIAQIITANNIDICYVQLVRMGMNIPFELPVKYYLDYMDALSEGMNKRVNFSKWYEKFFVREEARRLKWYEEKIAEHFDQYSIISQSDADCMPESIKNKIHIIPNGVNEDFFITRQNQEPKKYDIIFTGNMNYHPNIQACKYLVNQILPAIEAKGMKVNVCLAGTNPSSEVLALKSDRVHVTGYVEDLKPYLHSSKIFVAPLFSGSGLQNKLLEAMAAGLPTITTSLANKALKAKDKKEILICNEPQSFAAQIIFLLNHPQEAADMARLGRLYIRENFNWRACNALLEKSLKTLFHTKNA